LSQLIDLAAQAIDGLKYFGQIGWSIAGHGVASTRTIPTLLSICQVALLLTLAIAPSRMLAAR